MEESVDFRQVIIVLVVEETSVLQDGPLHRLLECQSDVPAGPWPNEMDAKEAKLCMVIKI